MEVMIPVGYHKIGAYRLFNPINEKIIINIDVITNKNEAWNYT